MGIKKDMNFIRYKDKYIHSNIGFTLIEIMIVIAIICILLILAYLVLTTQLAKGRDSKRKSDIYYIKEAVEEYEKDHDCYPNPLPACNPGDGLRPYLNKIPCDPTTKVDYNYVPDPDHQVCPQWYWIFSELEYRNDPQIEKLGCLNGCGPVGDVNYNYYQTSPNAPEPVKGESPPTEPPSIPPSTITPPTYYGCYSGICSQIIYDPVQGPCTPNYFQSNCNNSCLKDDGTPQNECEY